MDYGLKTSYPDSTKPRTWLKSQFPWLRPVIRGFRRMRNGVREKQETALYRIRGRQGSLYEIRPNLHFRAPQSAWRKSFHAFAPDGYCADEFDAFLKTCHSGMAIIDVGANFGIFSLATLKAHADSKALAIDPAPGSIEMLKELRTLNKFADQRLLIRECAIGDTDGSITVDSTHWDHVAVTAKENGKARAVELRSLDSLSKELKFAPTHIKIDVEGFELAVLRGGLEVLRTYRPVLMLEIHDRILSKADAQAIQDFLEREHYQRHWQSLESDVKGAVVVRRTLWHPAVSQQ